MRFASTDAAKIGRRNPIAFGIRMCGSAPSAHRLMVRAKQLMNGALRSICAMATAVALGSFVLNTLGCSRPPAREQAALSERGQPQARSGSDWTERTGRSGPPSVHRGGLVLGAQPPEIRVVETDIGFRVDPVHARRMRNPWSVELRLADVASPGAPETRLKMLGDREAHYRAVMDDGGGSGGPLHTLTAWVACGPKRIVMVATQQAEPPGTPDWSFAWALLEASYCQ